MLLEETLPPAQKTAEMLLFEDADSSYVQHISFDTSEFSNTDGKITVSKFVPKYRLQIIQKPGFMFLCRQKAQYLHSGLS